MYIKVRSSRHTTLGMLRFGCVYKLDEKDTQVKKVIKPLMEGDHAPLTRLTAKQVRAARLEYLDLSGPALEGADLEKGEGEAG
ncbi:hypothetical protein [Pseudovibrio sp. Tun.PSC04-5.I4]|uniref:hypothetical protein n=1 Tax=Pseudovibrio sp. Tun.PSC04-5.I4 TaxID=1798213 RepID=UPI0008874647|nr:hypothetical protein [Pseudovibrio sp. Tun.PSC04-5.I4]SDR19963.1 hypothetical protein SAMN04515695_3353 [Pseudovibrio sp. Tun.PSC04-5.I4]